jgi:hypothetical protein
MRLSSIRAMGVTGNPVVAKTTNNNATDKSRPITKRRTILPPLPGFLGACDKTGMSSANLGLVILID